MHRPLAAGAIERRPPELLMLAGVFIKNIIKTTG
jgi:hypothetical protein